jgi:NAD(P)-dependent dehydrogenase (short-subunit alcohol dehydrogenase family)
MMTTNNEGPVALFAGATAGLGEAILKAYARKHTNARIYFVGRNKDAAQQIEDDVRREWKENPQNAAEEGEVIFLKADLSLLRNSRMVLQEFLKREGSNAKLDFLCMSQGILTLKARLG